MSESKEFLSLTRYYKDVTGKTEVDPREVAKFGLERGLLPPPKPMDAAEIVAKKISRALRDEMRHDKETGRPYRANHAMNTPQGSLWVDIDEATRPQMKLSLQQRRAQMVGDAVQLSFDAEHWNAKNSDEEPIAIVLDFTEDVEERKNEPPQDSDKAAE